MGSCCAAATEDAVEHPARSDAYKENETTTHERVSRTNSAAGVGAAAGAGEIRTEISHEIRKVPEPRRQGPRKDDFTELADREGQQGELSELSLTYGGFLGRGAYCSVVWAIESETGRRIAVKQGMPKTRGAASLIKEAKVLSQLAHPNVVCYYDFKTYPNEVCLYEEYMTGGSLKSMIDTLVGRSGPNSTGMTEDAVRRFTVHILIALAYIHDHNVVHCDIKSSNILLDSHGNVKLSDFGSAWEMDNSDSNWKMRGTFFWMAPELLKGEAVVSPATDVWALGATIIEMLTGKPPFYHLGQIPAMTRIARLKHKEGRCPLKLPQALSPHLKHFLQRIFTVDPAKRATVEQLLRHDWLRPALDAGVSSAAMPQRIPLRTVHNRDYVGSSSNPYGLKSESQQQFGWAASPVLQRSNSFAGSTNQGGANQQQQQSQEEQWRDGMSGVMGMLKSKPLPPRTGDVLPAKSATAGSRAASKFENLGIQGGLEDPSGDSTSSEPDD